MPRPPKGSICAYCGRPAVTMDHIPPQSLLVGVPKSKRPWVPSCSECNGGASDDDEYFTHMLTMRKGLPDLPAAQPLVDAAMRALHMPRKRLYVNSIARGFRQMGSDADGEVVARFALDEPRLARTLRRYLHGFHARILGVVPDGHEIHAFPNVEGVRAILKDLPEDLTGGVVHVVQQDTFWFKVLSLPPAGSLWTLCFFESYPMIGLVGPVQE